MVNLYHRKNEIAIDFKGIQNIAAIQIEYKGRMQGESQLESDWIMALGKSKILCVSLGTSIPELLLNYVGKIEIQGGKVIDRSLNSYSINVLVEDIDFWERFNVPFDKNTQYWDGLGSNHQFNKSIIHSSVVKNNLISNIDEFYFADGTPFNGEYHLHGDGQAMTGGVHAEDSEMIYRKDLKGNIVNMRTGDAKKRAMQVMESVKYKIPSLRKKTRSYSNAHIMRNKSLQKFKDSTQKESSQLVDRENQPQSQGKKY